MLRTKTFSTSTGSCL